MREIKTISKRFDKHVDKSGVCHIWTACISTNGYGRFRSGINMKMAHRVSYEINVGPIPKNLLVMHSCDNRLCVNPKHLSVGRHTDNSKDMVMKDRQAKGSKQGSAKLNEKQVKIIKQGLSEGKSCIELGRQFGVTVTPISRIKRGITWKHV